RRGQEFLSAWRSRHSGHPARRRHQSERDAIWTARGRRLDHHSAGGQELPARQRADHGAKAEGSDPCHPHRARLHQGADPRALSERDLSRGWQYGVAAAAHTYWDKSLPDLTIAACAYLATLPKAPSNYDPFRYPDRAVARRNWVIDRIVENGFATRDEGEAAKASPLGVTKRSTGPKIFASEFFAEEVRRDIIDRFGEDKLYGGGLLGRTPPAPRPQPIPRTGPVNACGSSDHRHTGWRGPVKTIDIKRDWGKTLGAIPVWSDIEPWRLAVVLDVAKDKAT